MKRRWARLALALAAVVLVTIGAGWAPRWWYTPDRHGPRAGQLRLRNGGAFGNAALPIGAYSFTLKPATRHLKITEGPNGPTLFENEPGASFLAISFGEETVTESRGLFRLRERQYLNVTSQLIGSVTPLPGGAGVSVRGTLASDDTSTEYNVLFTPDPAGGLQIEATATPQYGLGFPLRVQVLARAGRGERFLGFGEQFNRVDLTGKRVPVLLSEQGIGRGLQPVTFVADLLAGAGGDWSTTYAPLPITVTTALRRFQFHAVPYAECDLRAPGLAGFKAHGRALQLTVDAAPTPVELLARARQRTGGMPPLPDWILSGAIVGMQGGTARVREEFAALKALDVPMAAFWLQDWCGQRKTAFGKQLWWNWELDRERYPGWEELITDLAKNGTRVMTYVNPFLVDTEGKTRHKRNLFREARDLGYLATAPDGTPHQIPNTDFSAGILDLRREEVRDWMAEVMRAQVIGVGAAGWMADYGESLPWDIVGTEGGLIGNMDVPLHNAYPEWWAETNAQACGDNNQLVYFMRSASAGSVAQTRLFWLGDQLVTWDEFDGIKTAVTGLLSSGLSGMVFNHSDIGGYTTITNPIRDYHRSKELLLRWMELNAFTAIFRTHEGNDPEKNAQFYTDGETMAHFARCAKIYAAWFPYRKDLAREGSEMGLPVVRHPWIHYWTDPEVLKIVYQQFMVGSEFMVAPVLDPGVAQVRTYLPAGRWINVWSDAALAGPAYHEVDAPLGWPAVFHREGSAAGDAFRAALEAQGLRAGRP